MQVVTRRKTKQHDSVLKQVEALDVYFLSFRGGINLYRRSSKDAIEEPRKHVPKSTASRVCVVGAFQKIKTIKMKIISRIIERSHANECDRALTIHLRPLFSNESSYFICRLVLCGADAAVDCDPERCHSRADLDLRML